MSHEVVDPSVETRLAHADPFDGAKRHKMLDAKYNKDLRVRPPLIAVLLAAARA